MKLIYVMDPYCGWCYGNSQTMLDIYNSFKSDFEFDLIPGGMWTGQNAPKQTPQLVNYVRTHDPRVAELTGAKFTPEYYASLDYNNIILDSEVPSRAITVIKHYWNQLLFPFASRVQQGRFIYGHDLNSKSAYQAMCEEFEIPFEEFLDHFESKELWEKTQAEFKLGATFARSFPTLILQKDEQYYLLAQGFTPFDTLSSQLKKILSTPL